MKSCKTAPQTTRIHVPAPRGKSLCRRLPLTITKSTETQASTSGRSDSSDPFVSAALRLQNLLRGVGSGDDELIDQVVASEPVEAKLQTGAAIGGMITVSAVIIATLCGKDPWGGMSVSFDSLSWAAVGALASLPLVGLRIWSWSPAASKSLPALSDMHQTQLQNASPWFQGMSRWQVAMMVALEVLPTTLILFPAAQGVILSAGVMYTQLLDPVGMDNPEVVSEASQQIWIRLAGLLLTAGIAASGRGMELSVSEDEYEVVQTAIDNADRYYRLMSMNVESRGTDAERSSLAFKTVAEVYLESRSDASLLLGSFTFADVMYLGGLWYLTGDLAAPAVASLATNLVDNFYIHEAVCKKEERSKNSGGESKV